MLDKILERLGLKYEDLNQQEKETLQTWIESLQKNRITVESIRKYIISMRESVENELTKSDIGSKQDLFLKARLRNYMLLDAFLTSPERAQQQLENALSTLTTKR